MCEEDKNDKCVCKINQRTTDDNGGNNNNQKSDDNRKENEKNRAFAYLFFKHLYLAIPMTITHS